MQGLSVSLYLLHLLRCFYLVSVQDMKFVGFSVLVKFSI